MCINWFFEASAARVTLRVSGISMQQMSAYSEGSLHVFYHTCVIVPTGNHGTILRKNRTFPKI